jgi:outer membrane immunogenic protein
MNKIFLLLAVSSLFALSMYAQTPRVDFFAGYSYLRSNPSQANYISAGNLSGGITSISYNFNDHVAAEFDFGFYHNTHNGDVDNTSVSYMFGPRISYGRSRKIDPFVHALFGGMHSDVSIDATSSLLPAHPVQPLPTPTGGRYRASQANFAMALGGGLDFHLTKGLYFRAAEFDYLLTRFEAPSFLTPTGATSNRNQNNFRLAIGIGFNFGSR